MNTPYFRPGPAAEPASRVRFAARGPWRVASLCLTGPRHEVCEDAAQVRFTPDGGLHVALADGVSQGARGDLASGVLVDHCVALEPGRHGRVPTATEISGCLEAAEAHVREALAAVTDQRGAATLAAVWLDSEGEARLSHVGDCRIYGWRPEGAGRVMLRALTEDQSYRQLREPPPPGASPDNPARMVGVGALGDPPCTALRLYPGDGLLLCSDGLHDVLDGEALADAMASAFEHLHSDDALAILAAHLARRAQNLGSIDDIGVLLVRWGEG
jgi:serine/threonine protein phosphatase PrpC